MSAPSSNHEVTKGDLPGRCEECGKLLFNIQMWRGHQTGDTCDGYRVIPGLPGGVQP